MASTLKQNRYPVTLWLRTLQDKKEDIFRFALTINNGSEDNMVMGKKDEELGVIKKIRQFLMVPVPRVVTSIRRVISP